MKWALAMVAGAYLVGCGGSTAPGSGPDGGQDSLQVPEDAASGGVVGVGGKLFSIPSPVETALLIRKVGLPYEKGLLVPTGEISRFESMSRKALAMGVYGADLAYVTIHKDGQQAMYTLQTVEQLSQALDLQNAFDRALVERFKRSISSEDSLLRFSGAAFRSAQEYLKNNSRDEVSAMILVGGWVESMYLSVAQLAEEPDARIVQRLAEQKRTLGNLVALVERTDKDGGLSGLLTGLKELQSAYQGVELTYEFKQPTVDAAARTSYINSTSSARLAPGAVRTIKERIIAIRSSIIA